MTPWTDDERREYERLVLAMQRQTCAGWYKDARNTWSQIEALKNKPGHGGLPPPPKPPSTPETSS